MHPKIPSATRCDVSAPGNPLPLPGRETPCTPILRKVQAALADLAASADARISADLGLITAARKFIPFAIDADRLIMFASAMDADPLAADDETKNAEALAEAATARANAAALPILSMPARSLAGLVVKAALAAWCNGDDPAAGVIAFDNVNNKSAADSLIHDLLALADLSGLTSSAVRAVA